MRTVIPRRTLVRTPAIVSVIGLAILTAPMLWVAGAASPQPQDPGSLVQTSMQSEVGVVLEGRRRELVALASLARARRLHLSVVATTDLTPADTRRLRRAGLEPIPALSAHGLRSALQTRYDLSRQKALLGLTGPFAYLAPRGGLTVSEYLIGRHLGGRPVPIRLTAAPPLRSERPRIATA